MTTKAHRNLAANLVVAKENLARIAASRPSHVSIVDLGVWSKGPYKALVIRGGLLWRSEELGRLAIEALSNNDRAVGITLSRSVIENVALHWRLSIIVRDRGQTSRALLDETLTKMLMGWRGDDEFPSAFNVLTMIDHLDREVEGVRAVYDQLSEVAHPNYSGVHGLFAQVDQKNFVTHFGNDRRGGEASAAAASALAASLGIQIVADQIFAEELRHWLAELPTLDEPREPD